MVTQQEPVLYDPIKRKASLVDRSTALRVAAGLAMRVPGAFIEFGTAEGHSTRVLAQCAKGRKMYALDSWEGLPEAYEKLEVGAFAGEPPKIKGVEIVKGYFDQTCTPELARRVGRIALANLDADLYSSTLCALRFIGPLLDTGSILIFDEFLSDNRAEQRAFEDWSAESGIKTLKVAEFVRDPAGGGDFTDTRPVYQVIGTADMPVVKKQVPLTKKVRLAAGRAKRAILGGKNGRV